MHLRVLRLGGIHPFWGLWGFQRSLSAATSSGPAARYAVGWHRHGVCRSASPAQLYPAGAVGQGLHRSVVAADRSVAPNAGAACWYGLRAWIEQGFKIINRAGWQWQRTRMTDPQRAARLWLAVAVATLWLLSVGGEAEDTIPIGTLLLLPPGFLSSPRQRHATRLRLVSVFRQGWIAILVALLNHRRLPTGCFVPEPWSQSENRRAKLQVTPEFPLAA
jgi:hypothetical protein